MSNPLTGLASTRAPEPESFKCRRDLHLARKIWHATSGTLLAFGYIKVLPHHRDFLILLVSLAAAFLIADWIRLKSKLLNVYFGKTFRILMRRDEMAKPNSASYYITGVLLSFLIFPKPIFLTSLLFLAWGDPIAAFFGQLFGKRKIHENASYLGCFACFTTCALITFAATQYLPIPVMYPFLFALGGGLAGFVAEVIPLRLDDNVIIPLLSGAQLWLLTLLL